MSDTVKSIEKALTIVECFSFENMELSISDLQRKTGYPKSTIFRLLSTLEKRNYIEQNKESQKYRLGYLFFRLGSIVQESLDFRKVALPIMRKLAEETNETVTLNTVDGSNRVCIDRVDSPETVRNFVRIGERNSLYQGASGKTMLAFLPVETRENLFNEEKELIPDLEKLRREVKEIQKGGYGISREERIKGSFSVAAPIFEHNGQLIAGLSIAGPIQRLHPEHETFLIKKVIESSKLISEKLGYISSETYSSF